MFKNNFLYKQMDELFLYDDEEIISFVEKYEPRIYASDFGEYTGPLDDIRVIKIKKSDWKYFLCHVSYKVYNCGNKEKRPNIIIIEYTKDAFERFSSIKDYELIDKFGFWNEFIFQCSDDSDANSFHTKCY